MAVLPLATTLWRLFCKLYGFLHAAMFVHNVCYLNIILEKFDSLVKCVFAVEIHAVIHSKFSYCNCYKLLYFLKIPLNLSVCRDLTVKMYYYYYKFFGLIVYTYILYCIRSTEIWWVIYIPRKNYENGRYNGNVGDRKKYGKNVRIEGTC